MNFCYSLLPLRHLFVRVGARLAWLSARLRLPSRIVVVVPGVVVIVVMAVRSSPAGLAATATTCGTSGAVVGFTVGVGGRI